jgi:hypothetical protein
MRFRFAHLYVVQGSNGGQWHAVQADDSDVIGADDLDVVAETIESPPWDVRQFALYRVVRRAVPPDVTEGEVKVFAADAVRTMLVPFSEQHRAEARKVSPRAFFEWLLTALVAQSRLVGVELSGFEFRSVERVVGSIPPSLTWDEVYPGEAHAVTQEKEGGAG